MTVGSADVTRTVDAVWRIESARIVATLAKVTGDVGRAEDLAHDALVEAMTQWAVSGIPNNPGAWLTAVAKRRAIDDWRRAARLAEKYRLVGTALDESYEPSVDPIDDDILRLVFTACHPVLSRESQVALTLRVVGGLTAEEVARMLLVPLPTVQARITRAKKTLAAAGVPFETPDPSEWKPRLSAVLGVAYLIFTEGYSATSGTSWVRPELAEEGLRLARRIVALVPREAEAHALVALMEFQASRFAARTSPDGTPVLLQDQDRRRWDHAQIRRGQAALAHADALGRGRGPYALQAAIAEHHSRASSVATTDWDAIVILYEVLGRLAPNPIVELNRAVAVAMTGEVEQALSIVEGLRDERGLQSTHLLASVRGELLARLGRRDEARAELLEAADLAANARTAETLRAKASDLSERSSK